MLAGNKTVCIAASGGPDSTALLHVLTILKPKLGITLTVCHFNHMIRPEAKEDAEFVESMAMQLGYSFKSYSDTTPPKHSIQKIARERRYSFFKKLLTSGFTDLIATGHTMDDSVETSIMWMLRGVGPTAFGGIPPKRNKFIRPLIDTRKSDLLEWLATKKIQYRLDQSNQTDKYKRNSIRQKVIPALKKENSRALESIARLAKHVLNQSQVIDDMAIRFIDKNNFSVLADSITLVPHLTMQLPKATRLALYRIIFQRVGLYSSCLTSTHLEAIDALLCTEKLGRNASLPGEFFAILDHDGLTLGKSSPPESFVDTPFQCPLKLITAHGNIIVGQNKPTFGRCIEEINMDLLPTGSLFRLKESGDWLRPVNFNGRKKLKKYLIEKKIPYRKRDSLPVLASNSEVLWIPGFFLSQNIRSHSNATEHVYLCLE